MCEETTTVKYEELSAPESEGASMGDPEPATTLSAPVDVWIKIEPCEPQEEPCEPQEEPCEPSEEPRGGSPAASASSDDYPLNIKFEPQTELKELVIKQESDRDSNTPKFVCAVCDRVFKAKHSLSRHVAQCRGRPDLCCPVCFKLLRNQRYLRSHLQTHQNSTPYACDMCDMKFKYKCSVQRHKMLHYDMKPYACPTCGKRFTSRCLMVPHIRTHTKEKPFQCPMCLKHFSHKYNMQQHMLRHNKLKHLVCDVCHKEFPKESRLKYHMRVHLEENRPFKCQECPKKYSHKQNVLRHYKKKHPNAVYVAPGTDAGLATKAWEDILKKRAIETDFILPEIEPNPDPLYDSPNSSHSATEDDKDIET